MGTPLSAAIAFLLDGPIVNPIVASSTAIVYFGDWHMVAGRIIFGYLIAVVIGLLMDLMLTRNKAVRRKVFADFLATA